MFEKVKKGISRVKGNVEKARAKSRGLSVAEYREEEVELKALRKRKRRELRKLRVEQSFERRKKEVIRRGGKSRLVSGAESGLDLITGMGRNVLSNVDDSSTSNFNRALTGDGSTGKRRKKKSKKKRKPRRVVTEYY